MNSWWTAVAKFESFQRVLALVARCSGGGRGVSWCRCSSSWTNISFVRMREEDDYERRLNELLRQVHLPSEPSFRPPRSLHIIVLDVPFNMPYFVTNPEYWRKSIDYEVRLRERSRPDVFLGWQRVEVFAVRPHQSLNFHHFCSFTDHFCFRYDIPLPRTLAGRPVLGPRWSYCADRVRRSSASESIKHCPSWSSRTIWFLSKVETACCVCISLLSEVSNIFVSHRVLAVLARPGYKLAQGLMDWDHLLTARCTKLSENPSQKWVWYNLDRETASLDLAFLVLAGGVIYVDTSSSWKSVICCAMQYRAAFVTIVKKFT